VINTTTEHVISLEKAAERVAEAQGRERMSTKTLYRWSRQGLRGVVLETVQAGGKKATTLEALDRFFRALTPEPPAPAARSPLAMRQRGARVRSGRASTGGVKESAGYAATSEALDRLGL